MIEHEKSVQALKALHEARQARPDVPLLKLVDEAARRHDLDAGQSDWLLRMVLAPAPGEAPAECPQCRGELQEAEGIAGHLRCADGHLVPRRRQP